MCGTVVVSALVLGSAATAASAAPVTAPAAPVQPTRSSVLAIDRDHGSVVLFRPGQPARTVVSGLIDPVSLATDRRSTAYVLDAGRRQLLKVTVATGRKVVLRSGIADSASIAVDDGANLYLLDGTTVLAYAAGTGRQRTLGPTQPGGRLTVDGRGDVSISSPLPTVPTGVRIKTFPAGGGSPTYRIVTVLGQTGSGAPGQVDSFGYLSNAVESRDGTVILDLVATGASGAHFFLRVPAGSPLASYLGAPYAEYAYTFDRNSTFVLTYNRLWCLSIARHFGCVDDYGVDSVDRFAPGATTPAVRPVADLALPVGGIAVDDTGRLYGAVLVSRFATDANDGAQPALVTVAPTGGTPTVLAAGHFSSPAVFYPNCVAAA